MTDDTDRRDDPRWDARAAEWARIESDCDGWCVVLYGTGPDGERAEDVFLVLHRHQQREDCEIVHGSLVQLLGDAMERETRGRDAALDAADRLAARMISTRPSRHFPGETVCECAVCGFTGHGGEGHGETCLLAAYLAARGER